MHVPIYLVLYSVVFGSEVSAVVGGRCTKLHQTTSGAVAHRTTSGAVDAHQPYTPCRRCEDRRRLGARGGQRANNNNNEQH